MLYFIKSLRNVRKISRVVCFRTHSFALGLLRAIEEVVLTDIRIVSETISTESTEGILDGMMIFSQQT